MEAASRREARTLARALSRVLKWSVELSRLLSSLASLISKASTCKQVPFSFTRVNPQAALVSRAVKRLKSRTER